MIKPFLTNKGYINREEIILKCDNETITEGSVLAEMFTLHKYCRKNTGEKSSHFYRDSNVSDTTQAIDLMFNHIQTILASIALRLFLKIKSPQLHLLAMLVEQIQKKYLNF